MVRNAAQSLSEQLDHPSPGITLKTRVVRTFTIDGVKHRMVARIDIIDNGPGIDPDLIDEIFYPMISSRPGGTGLGLAITQAVIGQHGGVIESESRSGRTCFSVFLPLEPDDTTAPNRSKHQEHRAL